MYFLRTIFLLLCSANLLAMDEEVKHADNTLDKYHIAPISKTQSQIETLEFNPVFYEHQINGEPVIGLFLCLEKQYPYLEKLNNWMLLDYYPKGFCLSFALGLDSEEIPAKYDGWTVDAVLSDLGYHKLDSMDLDLREGFTKIIALKTDQQYVHFLRQDSSDGSWLSHNGHISRSKSTYGLVKSCLRFKVNNPNHQLVSGDNYGTPAEVWVKEGDFFFGDINRARTLITRKLLRIYLNTY